MIDNLCKISARDAHCLVFNMGTREIPFSLLNYRKPLIMSVPVCHVEIYRMRYLVRLVDWLDFFGMLEC